MSEVTREVPRQMRFLKALVIFFAILLIAAAGILIAAGLARMGKSSFDLATLPVPDGCRVEQMAVEGDRLILSIGGPGLISGGDCRRVLIADMKSGRLIGRFELKDEK
ncbi:hypothetical protein [Dongia sp.]|uniref:hypothetical protein n=1 Tax=Dongia sp. TaxID=1977262 RepID=UPI0035ADBD9A